MSRESDKQIIINTLHQFSREMFEQNQCLHTLKITNDKCDAIRKYEFDTVADALLDNLTRTDQVSVLRADIECDELPHHLLGEQT